MAAPKEITSELTALETVFKRQQEIKNLEKQIESVRSEIHLLLGQTEEVSTSNFGYKGKYYNIRARGGRRFLVGPLDKPAGAWNKDKPKKNATPEG